MRAALHHATLIESNARASLVLTPGTTAPFEVPVNARAPQYRVSVFAFDWVQHGRGPN